MLAPPAGRRRRRTGGGRVGRRPLPRVDRRRRTTAVVLRTVWDTTDGRAGVRRSAMEDWIGDAARSSHARWASPRRRRVRERCRHVRGAPIGARRRRRSRRPRFRRLAAPNATTVRRHAVTKYVYDFSEGNRDMKDLLGGKGANLAEMTNMGLPVPPGFTITTEACLTYLRRRGAARRCWRRSGSTWSASRRPWASNLGDPDDPLLVSVRSGAKFSMPGMMDTVLNLGLNDESVKGLAEADRRRHAVRQRRLPPIHPDVRQDRDGRARPTRSSTRSTRRRSARARARRTRTSTPTTSAS